MVDSKIDRKANGPDPGVSIRVKYRLVNIPSQNTSRTKKARDIFPCS